MNETQNDVDDLILAPDLNELWGMVHDARNTFQSLANICSVLGHVTIQLDKRDPC